MTAQTPDVIILGAGAAGLAAARRLTAAGRTVTVVEARDRLGGRIHTLRPAGWPVPVEAGAEFIHGLPEETWQAVRSANLVAYQVAESSFHSPHGKPQPLDFDDAWGTIFERLQKFARDDLSFAEFLKQHCSDVPPENAAHATAYVEGFNAADSRQISTKWLVASDAATGQGGDASAFRLVNGYDAIVSWLADGAAPEKCEFRLSNVVKSVHWQPGDVRIELASASGSPLEPIRAPLAIVTLPLGVLRAPPGTPGAVQFVPDLAEKWSASAALRMGPVVKLIVRFREPFWDREHLDDLGFLHAPDEPFPTWWTTHPLRTPILTAWAGGPAAEQLAGVGEREILNRALDSLSRLFGTPRARLDALLDAWHIADWPNDPFARGAYSYVGTGNPDAPRQLAQPIESTLFFAGEATHDTLSGTVAGAIATGYRAADEVLQSVGVQSSR